MRVLVMIAVTGCGFTGPPSNGLTGLIDAPNASDAPQAPDAPAIIGDARFVDGAAMPDAGTMADAAMMADAKPLPDAPPQICYSSAGFQVCAPQPPSQSLEYSSNTMIDTSKTTAGNCDFLVGTPAVCLISRISITFDDHITVRAFGPNPIVFGATSSITVTGTLDVSSNTGGTDGAGANPGGCNNPTAAGASSSGAAGGAAGSFTTSGGDGGNGHTGANGGNHGSAIAQPVSLRGGCPGGAGGMGQDVNGPSAGVRGSGGGALALFAGSSITINNSGYIDASGAGGGGGQDSKGGGGGGGSGGMIVLDSPSVSVAGLLYANGGGGGGGAGATHGGSTGFETVPGHIVTETGGGSGGNDTPNGGNGGAGATRNAGGGNGAQTTDTGAGGGGGSVGAIHVISGQSINAANVSPAPT